MSHRGSLTGEIPANAGPSGTVPPLAPVQGPPVYTDDAAGLKQAVTDLMAKATVDATRYSELRAAFDAFAARPLTLPSFAEATSSYRLPPGCRPNAPNTYAGNRDADSLDSWLFAVTQYLDLTGVREDERRILLAGTYLEGPAQTWYRAVQGDSVPVDQKIKTWDTFQGELRLNFCPLNQVKLARDRLHSLRQTGSLREYIREFRNCTLEIVGMAEDEKLDRFVRHLAPAIRQEVEIQEPEGLDKAIKLSERFDAVLHSSHRSRSYQFAAHRDAFRRRDPGRRWESGRSGPAPMELGYMGHDQRSSDSDEGPANSPEASSASQRPQSHAVPRGTASRASGFSNNNPPTVNYMANQQRRENSPGRLPDAERERLMRENRCFLCKEQGHQARDCPTRRAGQGNGYRGRAAPPRGRSPQPTGSRR